MKRSLLILSFLAVNSLMFAQISGLKTIPGSYTTIAAALADLNGNGVGPGGVTYNIAAGYMETITAPLSLTVTGTLANPIVFQKSGSGNNPKITAYSGGTATANSNVQDGIWNLIGSDYVTIDGIDLYDPNTANPATMEYGYGFFKANASNGCQNNIITNCVITLNRINTTSGSVVDGSRGINITNSLVTAQNSTLTATTAAGANSYNKFYNNTIQNCLCGIYIYGYSSLAPFTACDIGNDIGGNSSLTGNNFLNFGGGPGNMPAQGIMVESQININISYNTISVPLKLEHF